MIDTCVRAKLTSRMEYIVSHTCTVARCLRLRAQMLYEIFSQFSLEIHAHIVRIYLLRLKSELYFIQSSPIPMKILPKWKQLHALAIRKRKQKQKQKLESYTCAKCECECARVYIGFAADFFFFELGLRATRRLVGICSISECKIIVVNTHVYILFECNLKMVLAQPNRQKSRDA